MKLAYLPWCLSSIEYIGCFAFEQQTTTITTITMTTTTMTTTTTAIATMTTITTTCVRAYMIDFKIL